MVAPSVSYELFNDYILLKGPEKQLQDFIEEYNDFISDDYTELNEVNPIIYKKYKK